MYNATQSKRKDVIHVESGAHGGPEDGEAKESIEGVSAEAVEAAVDADDPMAGDVFDTDEALNRRAERIETENFGSVYAR